MKVQNTVEQNYRSPQVTATSSTSATSKQEEPKTPVIQDEYIPGQEEKKVTYKNPKVDTAALQKVKAESERSYQQLRELVRQMLEKQGMTFQDIVGFGEDIPVDEETRVAAQAMIEGDGPYSPESVSNRLVDFAKAISGGDKSKIELLTGAIEKGFEEAAKAWGGELPEISQKTYDLVKEKLAAWAAEDAA